MNNIRIYAFFWMIVLLTVSCYEDKGNYDYHPINEVKISGIKEDPYEILRWDTLKIHSGAAAASAARRPEPDQ